MENPIIVDVYGKISEKHENIPPRYQLISAKQKDVTEPDNGLPKLALIVKEENGVDCHYCIPVDDFGKPGIKASGFYVWSDDARFWLLNPLPLHQAQ